MELFYRVLVNQLAHLDSGLCCQECPLLRPEGSGTGKEKERKKEGSVACASFLLLQRHFRIDFMPPIYRLFLCRRFFYNKFLDSHKSGRYLIFFKADYRVAIGIDIKICILIYCFKSVNCRHIILQLLADSPVNHVFIRRRPFLHLAQDAFIGDFHVIITQKIPKGKLTVEARSRL